MSKKELSDGNFITIQAFMVRDLNLKGNELLIYAIIYGFTQTEAQRYQGGLNYIATWTSSTKQGVMKNLKSLVDKGFIAKCDVYKNGVKFVEYYATQFTTGKQSDESGKQSLTGYETEFNGGIKQSLPNNIDRYYKEDTNNNSYRQEPKKQGVENGGLEKFKRPTLEEVRAYCEERHNGVNPDRWYDFYTANGWKVGKNPMKDWKAAVRTWERSTPKKERRSDLDDIF